MTWFSWTNSTKCHLICPPLAWITCSSLLWKPSAALHRVSWGIFAHAFSRKLLRASTDTWEEAQASALKKDQTQKSVELRSGDEGGQTSLLQNPGKWSWHHFCVFLDLCDVALSCWKMNDLSLKCFLAAWSAGVKIVSMYAFVFIFAPCGTKMMGDFHVFEMAAHTMTEEGFCHLKTLLVESGMSAEDFTRTLSFCRLQIASTVNNFSSEKIILHVHTCLQLVNTFAAKWRRSPSADTMRRVWSDGDIRQNETFHWLGAGMYYKNQKRTDFTVSMFYAWSRHNTSKF